MHHSLSLLALALSLCSTALAQVAQPTAEEAPPRGAALLNRNEASPPTEKRANALQKVAPITDAERSALTFTAYDLEVHLVPTKSQLAVRAAFTVRNSSTHPLAQLAFQISSSLHWESFALRNAERLQPLTFGEHLTDTDADHTGQAKEAVVSLP